MTAIDAQEEISMLEQLSADVMGHLLIFMDIPSRVKLACCNTSLQQRVYRKCQSAWESLDFFYFVDYECRVKLTDHALSILLCRINAKEIVRHISLFGCSKIQGTGLDPLACSRVLEKVDLYDTGMADNPSPVLWTLRSMLPYSLFAVALPLEIVLLEEPDVVFDFMRDLSQAKAKQAPELGTLCYACQLPVVDRSRHMVHGRFGSRQTRFGCWKHFCGRASCPRDIRQCAVCINILCEDCNIVQSWCSCAKSYCLFDDGECNGIRKCEGCSKVHRCEDCEGFEMCDKCGCEVCPGCKRDCANGTCILCATCSGSGMCDKCESAFCVVCEEDYLYCEECDKKFCAKPDCAIEAKQCGACDGYFCKDCSDLEHCGGCDTDFCKVLGRLVDCGECHIHHCRECKSGKRKRCCLCSKACFEGCACDGQKKKRARLS